MATTPQTSPADETAQQLIERLCREQSQERLATLRATRDELDGDPDDRRRDELETEFEPLCIDASVELKITLSTGGPADGFTLTYTPEGELMRGVYWAADWFTYAEESLDDDEAEMVAQLYLGGEPTAFFPRIR